MRPLVTWLLVGVLLVIGLFAARDALQSEGTAAEPPAAADTAASDAVQSPPRAPPSAPRPARPPSPPTPPAPRGAAEPRAAGLRLWAVDASTERRGLRH